MSGRDSRLDPQRGDWTKGKFLISDSSLNRGRAVGGHTFAGLGIRQCFKQSPKGRRPGLWHVIHLGTGHTVCQIEATDARVWNIATDLANLGDWTFDGLSGWKNSDPELLGKFKAFCAARPEVKSAGGGKPNAGIAAQIATARA